MTLLSRQRHWTREVKFNTPTLFFTCVLCVEHIYEHAHAYTYIRKCTYIHIPHTRSLLLGKWSMVYRFLWMQTCLDIGLLYILHMMTRKERGSASRQFYFLSSHHILWNTWQLWVLTSLWFCLPGEWPDHLNPIASVNPGLWSLWSLSSYLTCEGLTLIYDLSSHHPVLGFSTWARKTCCVWCLSMFSIDKAHLGDFVRLELGKAEFKPGSTDAESWDSQPRNDVSLS